MRKKREAERREAHCSANVRAKRGARLPLREMRRLSALTLAALATGYHPDGSAPEPGFPQALADRCFACFAHTMPRLSTLLQTGPNAGRPGTRKPARVRIGNSARGDRISLSSYGMPSGRRPPRKRDGRVCNINGDGCQGKGDATSSQLPIKLDPSQPPHAPRRAAAAR